MARKSGRIYVHVLELMKKNGGRVDLDNTELIGLVGDTMYRVAGYIYDIRKYAKLEVRAIRNGRKVVAYELVASSPAPVTENTDASTSVTPATV